MLEIEKYTDREYELKLDAWIVFAVISWLTVAYLLINFK